METTNLHIISEIYSIMPTLTEKITNGFNKYYYFLQSLKYEIFEENQNETEEVAIQRVEGIYERLNEIINRNELANKKANETIEILNRMTELFNEIVYNTENEREGLALRNNELIDIIIDLKQRKTDKFNVQNPLNKVAFNNLFDNTTVKWDEHRIITKQISKPIYKPALNYFDENEMKLIEKWTGLKIGGILFDSNVDNWGYNMSVFDQKILNKNNLIFLIEDDNSNLFGGYSNIKIDKYGFKNDPKAFLFSLKSNGRLNGMVKFEIINNSQNTFVLYNQSNDYLFEIGNGCGGYDLCIFKENNKKQSYCGQRSFNYNGIHNALCGKTYPERFTPKRITVIQLIDFKLQEIIKKVVNDGSKKGINEMKGPEEERLKITNNAIDLSGMRQIEEWTSMKIGSVLFDSYVDNWDQNTSVFGKKIKNYCDILFLIEDEIGNKFGGYVNAKIEKYGYVNDLNSFLFSLKSNGRLNGMVKFEINDSKYAFYLFSKSNDCLFEFGSGKLFGHDIKVYKEKLKHDSCCSQQSYNYNGIKNALCGKQTFVPKRITVIQLIDVKQEKRKEIEDRRSVEDEMKQIEKWTTMKIGNIIFDSNIDDWKEETSVFGIKIFNKSKLIILIEDDDGNKFGGFINSKIDKYCSPIKDPKAFVFSIKSNGRLYGMMKFDIKDPKCAFGLYPQNKTWLLSIGNGGNNGKQDDINIMKHYCEGSGQFSGCKQSSFNYNGIGHALCGKRSFAPKRILAIQLI